MCMCTCVDELDVVIGTVVVRHSQYSASRSLVLEEIPTYQCGQCLCSACKAICVRIAEALVAVNTPHGCLVFWGLNEQRPYRDICCPFYLHGLTLIPAWISDRIHYKMWDEIAYPFLIFNGATVEVWELISNFIPHFTVHVITYPCWD